ncbi:hypothetical protein [Nonomuraea candida]|uniref:hypothetical protein n=1 Tax=Nonomuraea candida TaxID=359159 RepID=UPI0005BB7E7A|nr:hypothetical protein [Nonomuraea candida]
MTKILTIGLHPGAIDFSDHPGLDEALAARIEQGEAALRAAGLDTVTCLVGTDPALAEQAVRERLSAEGPFGVAMIGAGLRLLPEHTVLFERLVNVLVAAAPGIRFCFNTSPETTIDAIRRVR